MDRKFEFNYGLLGKEIMISESAPDNINELIEELTGKYGEMNMYKVLDIINDRNSGLFVASFSDICIVGMTTLVAVTIPTGRFGLVEDVVVHPDYQGQGIGTNLMARLIDRAKKLKLENLDLTSNPRRKPAHGLYKKFGFEERETDNFRLKLKP